MRASKAYLYISLLMSLILIGGCEQEAGPSTAEGARITFGENVHDKEVGNYIIHVNALTTDQLPQEIARGYNISRSKNRAMLNISVREKSNNGEIPITAKVTTTAKNLSNQLKDMHLREIKEDDPLAIYYIGEVSVSNEETLVFDMDITPAGASKPILLSYRQRFFTQ